MNRFFSGRAMLGLAVLLSTAPLTFADAPAAAKTGAGMAAKPPQPFVYLSDSSVDFVALLPAPPTPDSLEQQSEMTEIKAWQSLRTPDMEARCKDEEKLVAFRAFAGVMGANFTAEKMPQTAKLLAAIETDSKHFSSAAKNHWTRRRPPYVDPTLKPAALLEDEPSYPSGHATRGEMYALVLSQIAPDKADALQQRGQEIGFDRVIAAIHYPSDVVAGRVLGQAITRALLASPKFQKDLDAAQAEWHSVATVASR